jgi:hypothetical protein
MDKKDIFSFFLNLKNQHTDAEIVALLEHNEISKLDINRIYRYIEKYTTGVTDEKGEQDSSSDDE